MGPMGPIRCPQTSVKDYHSTLRNTPEERRSQALSSSVDLDEIICFRKERNSRFGVAVWKTLRLLSEIDELRSVDKYTANLTL
jgi:hypothetical protein